MFRDPYALKRIYNSPQEGVKIDELGQKFGPGLDAENSDTVVPNGDLHYKGNAMSRLVSKRLQCEEIPQLKTWLKDERAANTKLSEEKCFLAMKVERQRKEMAILYTQVQSIKANKNEIETSRAKAQSMIKEQGRRIDRQCKELAALNAKLRSGNAKEKENLIMKTKIARQCKELSKLNTTAKDLHAKESENKILKTNINVQSKVVERQRRELARLNAEQKRNQSLWDECKDLHQKLELILEKESVKDEEIKILKATLEEKGVEWGIIVMNWHNSNRMAKTPGHPPCPINMQMKAMSHIMSADQNTTKTNTKDYSNIS